MLTKLNTVHLTLTENSKRTLVQSFGLEAEARIIRSIASGKDGKFNGDNLDIRVHTNDIRMASKDRDYHFFASDFTVDRVNLDGLSKVAPNKDSLSLTVQHFIPNQAEYKYYTETLKILLARLLRHYDGLKWMESVVPDHIPHEYEQDMSKKSEVFILPVSLNNEASYQDCVHIMDEYESNINRWYSQAGRGAELQDLKVPVGGDQMTRIRLQGAKSLRAGAHKQSERFDHLDPIIIELFHTLQDFLEKLCQKYLDFNRSRDPGTLSNLKILIQRVNVNGKVKCRYKAHEDFITTCGIAYFYAYILSKFKMETLDGFPKHSAIKDTIVKWTNEPKRKVFHEIMDEVITDLFVPFEVQEPSIHVNVSVGHHNFMVSVENKREIKIPLFINHERYTIATTNEQLKKGTTAHVCGVDIGLKTVCKISNTLKTYGTNFLQWFFCIIQFKDAIKEGDVQRINITMKHMIPFFYSHSPLSKYLVECVDYILKTEHTLSPYMACKVRAASCVNMKGKSGKNKAADLHKENQVKYLKTLIRSLGANKTEQSIVSITKAGPVISEISDNFDEMTGAKKLKTTHKEKSRKEDIEIITEYLYKLKMWNDFQVNESVMNIPEHPFCFDRDAFSKTVMSKVQQLLLDVNVVDEYEDGDEDIQDDNNGPIPYT